MEVLSIHHKNYKCFVQFKSYHLSYNNFKGRIILHLCHLMLIAEQYGQYMIAKKGMYTI